MGSEVNVAGKIIYGYNPRLSDWTPPSGVTLDGWYRLSFAVAQGANVDLVAVGNTGDELVYVPAIAGSGLDLDNRQVAEPPLPIV